MKVLAVGGGSGGHVTPVLAVINQLAASDPSLQVRFVCDKTFERQARGLMEQAKVAVAVQTVTAGKFRRYRHLTFWQHFTVPSVVFGNTSDLIKILGGFLQSAWILIRHRPDVVFAKGGYVCLPMGLAAWILRIPLVIHDSDTRPGLTNKVLSRFAKEIATGSPLENYPYDRKKTHYVGVPIGKDFVAPVSSARQRELKQALGYEPTQKLIVATGGGLGAASINRAMLRVASKLAEHAIATYIITGKKHYDEVASAAVALPTVTAVPFVYSNMADILGAADVVVARGSATFLQELAGLKKAVVVIPARQLGDQAKNGEMFQSAKAAIVLDDSMRLGENDRFAETLVELCNDDAKRQTLAENLHAFARPNAARDLARLVAEAARR